MLDARTLAANLTTQIINPLIALLFAAGLVVFFWGIIEFLWGQSSSGDSGKKEEGKQHMLWGILGMFIMAAAYTILAFVASNVCGGLPTCTGT